MAEIKYAFGKFNKEIMARAIAKDAAVSTKQAIEIANYLRHRKLAQAKNLLNMVMEKKHAIPFKRFNDGVGHKPGKIAAGRYPVKASRVFLKLIESVEANAQIKGLNTSELELIHICAHKAHCPVHHGRHSGREFKRTHVEVVVKETAEKKKTKKQEKQKQKLKQETTQQVKQEKPKETTPIATPVESAKIVEKSMDNKPVEQKSAEQKSEKPVETKIED